MHMYILMYYALFYLLLSYSEFSRCSHITTLNFELIFSKTIIIIINHY